MDIKIVGAGPGGLIAALYLNEAGYKPTIYEKQNENGYKSTPCGEGISLARLKQLKDEVGFNSKPFISRKFGGFKMIFPNKKYVTIISEMVTLNRTEWLREMIHFLESENIEIYFNEEIDTIKDLDYSYLIGADGPNSKVRKELNVDIDIHVASQYKMKLERRVNDLKIYIDEMFHYKDLGGYGWIFPKGDTANVGVANSFDVLDNFLDKYNIEGKVISKEAAPIGINGETFSNPENDILLTGGAAGLTNPLTGGGLASIIKSSKFLIGHIKGTRNYDISIKKSSINPSYWKNAANQFYVTNNKYRKMGYILDGEKFTFEKDYKNKISLRTKFKFLLNPGMWKYVSHNEEIFKKLSYTF